MKTLVFIFSLACGVYVELDESAMLQTKMSRAEDAVTESEDVNITRAGCRGVHGRATDHWCNANCNHNPPFCPSSHCQCGAAAPKSCYATTNTATDQWCNHNCNNIPPYCPASHCRCGVAPVTTTRKTTRKTTTTTTKKTTTTTTRKTTTTTTTTTESCHDANGRNICFCSAAGCPKGKACCIAGFAGDVTEFDSTTTADRTSCVQAGSSWCEDSGVTYCGDGSAPHDPANCDESPGEGTDVVGDECFDADDGFGPDFSCANTTMFCSHDSASGLTVAACCPQECRKLRKEAERKRKADQSRNQEYWRKNKLKNIKAEKERKVKRGESTNKRKNAEEERKRKKADEEWKAKRARQEQRNKIKEGERKDKRGMTEARRKTEQNWKQMHREKKSKANVRERKRKRARNNNKNGNKEKEAKKKNKAAENQAKKGCEHEKNFKRCARKAGCEKGQKKKGSQMPTCQR